MAIIPIQPEILTAMLAETPTLQVLDVRTVEEYAQLGHIAEAMLIPLHELPYAYRLLNHTEPVVVTCQHGVRSLDACYFLEAQGFETLFNLQEGMSTWTGPTVLGYPQEETASPVTQLNN